MRINSYESPIPRNSTLPRLSQPCDLVRASLHEQDGTALEAWSGVKRYLDLFALSQLPRVEVQRPDGFAEEEHTDFVYCRKPNPGELDRLRLYDAAAV